MDFKAMAPTVLDFWFGPLKAAVAVPEGTIEMRRWFSSDAAIDADIAARFGDAVEAVAAAIDAGWRPADIDEALAAIILLDQFPRNIHRGTPGMYLHDGRALMLAKAFVDDPAAAELDLLRAPFLAMPLMHSEDAGDQARMLVHFRSFAERAGREAPANAGFFASSLKAAERHAEIIGLFGRFPHRNAILGRASTDAERAFLDGPDASF